MSEFHGAYTTEDADRVAGLTCSLTSLTWALVVAAHKMGKGPHMAMLMGDVANLMYEPDMPRQQVLQEALDAYMDSINQATNDSLLSRAM